MAEIQDFVIVDDSNVARWPEHMQFSDVNNSARKDEGILARWYKDTDSSIVASGSANAFAITSNRTIASLFNNLVMAFTANFSISGAATLNLNGLGAKSIKRFNGNDLTTGDIISGQPILVVYKSSPDVWYAWSALPALTGNTFADFSENASPGTPAADVARLFAQDNGSGTTRMFYIDSAAVSRQFLSPTTQTVMEAATSTDTGVTPALQKHHPAHPKAWGQWNMDATQTLHASYGLTSITDNGVGLTLVTMSTAMSSATYGIVSTCQAEASGSNARGWMSIQGATSITTTTFILNGSHNGSNNVDMPYVSMIAVGDFV